MMYAVHDFEVCRLDNWIHVLWFVSYQTFFKLLKLMIKVCIEMMNVN